MGLVDGEPSLRRYSCTNCSGRGDTLGSARPVWRFSLLLLLFCVGLGSLAGEPIQLSIWKQAKSCERGNQGLNQGLDSRVDTLDKAIGRVDRRLCCAG